MPWKIGFLLSASGRARRASLGVMATLLLAPALHAEDLAAALPGGIGTPPASVTTPAELDQGVDRARLVFTLSKAVEVASFLLSSPDRVIVDLPEIDFAIPQPPALAPRSRSRRPSRGGPSGLVATYRFGRLGPGRSRVIVNLTGPARILRATCEAADGGNGARLVIELARTDPAGFRAAVQATRAAVTRKRTDPRADTGTELWPARDPSPIPPSGKPVVVIDPGHGGIDSGAIVNGSVEKELVLGFAKAVATKLETDGRLTVVLTRQDDTFVPLSERVALARAAGAGLFVSLHADTLAEATDVAGATVYTVSERASDAAAARLAAKENNADAAAGLEHGEEASAISSILDDLTRRETRALSHVFARTLLNYWKVAGRLNKNPQRAAGFLVLKAPDVPSVLLELGYLTNQRDDRALSSAEWREAAATQVAEAIGAYFAARENAVLSHAPIRKSESEPNAAPGP
jgi:N-acetylmuramoyl-L-alanine amidase